MLDLQPIKARLSAATPGPWSAYRGFPVIAGTPDIAKGQWHVCVQFAHGVASNIYDKGDCDLIANAPADLADLVAEVERLRGAIKKHAWMTKHGTETEYDLELWGLVDA